MECLPFEDVEQAALWLGNRYQFVLQPRSLEWCSFLRIGPDGDMITIARWEESSKLLEVKANVKPR